MRAENPFEFAADPRYGRAGALISLVRMQTDAEHLPHLKGVTQHEQLGFRIGAGANGGAGKPGVANLAYVRAEAAVAVVPLRPREALNVEESRAADHHAVGQAHCRKGDGCSGIAPAHRGIDILGRLVDSTWDKTPAIELRIARRCLC